jgi:uncharacterized membrane protein YczE
VRLVVLVFGLAVFALGIVFFLEADLGLSPWDVLHQGVAKQTPLSFGTAHVAVSLVVLVVAGALGARVGIGTVANAVLVGVFVQLFTMSDAIDGLAGHGLPFRVALLGLGIALVGAATALYIGAAFGAGPRDSLMVVGSARTRFRIGVVRAALEATALAIGWILGGTVGVGTVAFVLLVGPAIEVSFWLAERLAPTASA